MELEGSCTAYGGTQGMCGLRGNLFGSTSRDDTLFETRSFAFIVYLLGLLVNAFFLAWTSFVIARHVLDACLCASNEQL